MYHKNAHIHFVGIGGIGMSGIAKILRYQGYHISGCDLDLEQKSIHDLRALNCTIYQGNNTPSCHDPSIDILVYSSALKPTNPEILAAQARGIPTIPRALMLAELMRTKFSIAIAGAHGKTTTTSMIAHILMEAHKDPTVIIGGHLTSISSNAQFGKGDFLVAEADESDRSILRLYPTLAVVTNIDFEHVDVYKDIDDIKQTFSHFLSNIPFYGKAFLCADDKHLQELPVLHHIKTIWYGIEKQADMYAFDVILARDHSTFYIALKNQSHALGNITLGLVHLAMPGRHNILNALAATAVALDLGVPFSTITTALQTFKGIDRRFTFKGTYKGAELFDDYGHHPTEIHHTLLVAQKRVQKKLIVIFQPHRYTRTNVLWHDFIALFVQHASSIDHLIITDIYPASEPPIDTITSQRLVKELTECCPGLSVTYVPFDDNFEQLQSTTSALIQPGDLVLMQGAGKMNKLAELLDETGT
jgi:UDP-N-acetylmuramate--alanine ligase